MIMSHQCDAANIITGFIKRGISSTDLEELMTSYEAVVGCHVHYYARFEKSIFKKEGLSLDQAKRRTTRMIRGLESPLSYKRILKKLTYLAEKNKREKELDYPL